MKTKATASNGGSDLTLDELARKRVRAPNANFGLTLGELAMRCIKPPEDDFNSMLSDLAKMSAKQLEGVLEVVSKLSGKVVDILDDVTEDENGALCFGLSPTSQLLLVHMDVCYNGSIRLCFEKDGHQEGDWGAEIDVRVAPEL